MKIVKNLYITCGDIKERQNVFSVLESDNQLKAFYKNNKDSHNIVVNPDGYFFTFPTPLATTREVLTHTQFMEKYAVNELQTKVNEAIAQGYTNTTLSEALGNHRNYIARLLKMKHKEETVNRVIQEIDILLGNKVIVDASVLKELDHKNQVLDKRNDKYNMLEADYNELKGDCDLYKIKISGLKLDNQALSSMRITAENKLYKERTMSAVVIIGLLLILGFITFIH